ncbi:hypothetical protein D043_2111A, partial [Vibrio parahaemolyticus EKP-021]
MALPPLQ